MSRPNSKEAVEIKDIARALAGIRQRSKATKRGGGFGGIFRMPFKKSA